MAEYLKPQRRFAHLFKDAAGSQRLARLQAIADSNIAEYKMLEHEEDEG